MAATESMIWQWYNAGKDDKYTHMIVVCDTYDWEDYPVYVSPSENVSVVFAAHQLKEMQRVMEVYDLSLPFTGQKMSGRFAMSF